MAAVETGEKSARGVTLSVVPEVPLQEREESCGDGYLLFGGVGFGCADDLRKGPGVVSRLHALRPPEKAVIVNN